MENKEEKESPARRIKSGLLAVAIMICLAGFVHYSTVADLSKDPLDVLELDYNNVLSYRMDGDTIDLSTKSPCKIVNSHLEYDQSTGDLVFQFEGNPQITYSGGQANGSSQLYITSAQGQPAAFTRVAHDSILVITEGNYFVILAKGKECKTFEDLPTIN